MAIVVCQYRHSSTEDAGIQPVRVKAGWQEKMIADLETLKHQRHKLVRTSKSRKQNWRPQIWLSSTSFLPSPPGKEANKKPSSPKSSDPEISRYSLGQTKRERERVVGSSKRVVSQNNACKTNETFLQRNAFGWLIVGHTQVWGAQGTGCYW